MWKSYNIRPGNRFSKEWLDSLYTDTNTGATTDSFPQPVTKAEYETVEASAVVMVTMTAPRAVKLEKSKKRKRKERKEQEEKRDKKKQKKEEDLSFIVNLRSLRITHACLSCGR